jgi:ubiquinone/menaquinone biosynthesis C-methylase UbiE
MGYLLASPVRRLWYDATTVVGPYVREGMTVLEPGPGMGFFTLELARLAGPSGHIVAVDIQPKMLASLRRRVARAGLEDRIDVRMAAAVSMGVADLAGTVDFVLAAAVVHELPDEGRFFLEAAAALKPGGCLLVVEPSGHVDARKFESELSAAARAGLAVAKRPAVRRSHAALLRK